MNSQDFEFAVRDIISDVIYTPWTDGQRVGFEAVHPDGRVEYLYLSATCATDDGVPVVFVYQGGRGWRERRGPALRPFHLH